MAEDVVDLKAGQFVWFVKANDPMPRPAQLISDGICETKKLANGSLQQFAHLAYGTADPTHVMLGHASPPAKANDPDDKVRVIRQRQTQEVTAPWDPTGAPGSWHLEGEALHMEHPKLFAAPKALDSRKTPGPQAP